jgi:predicted branched-subunit amino acid permease
MVGTTSKSAFWTGFRDMLPFILVTLPFGTLFGVLASEAGLDVDQVLAFSAAVFAGAAQFTALQLMQENAPVAIVVISALAVNLRMAMYSATLTPHMGAAPLWQRALAAYLITDQSFALASVKYETVPEMTLPQRMQYYAGTCVPMVATWLAACTLGAWAGAQIPESWGLDFALPIAFCAMIGPALRTPAHLAACFTACLCALFAAALPYNLGLIVAGSAGMAAGAQAELWLERRASTSKEDAA